MMTTAIEVATIAPIGHDEAMQIAEVEFARMLSAARDLDPADWTQPTVCTGWDVRAVMLHLLGAAESNASLGESVHQMRLGKRLFKQIGGHHWVDGINEIQIRERSGLTNAQVIDRYAAAIPKAVRTRKRLPRPVRALPVVDFGDVIGRKSVGYLMDVVYTRDVWMHRVDIARATGRPLELTAEHDGRIVADMVLEWTRLYGLELELDLTGPAGGVFTSGTGGERLEIDAIELVWVLSGRGAEPATGLLAHELPL